MYIFSLIISTIVSVVNAGITIIAISGGFSSSLTDTMAGVLPRTVAPLVYELILPVVAIAFILSFTAKKMDKQTKKSSVKFLQLSLGLTLLQAVVSVIIYQLSYSKLTAYQQMELNLVPVIIEVAVIFLTFAGSIIFAIKAAGNGDKIEFTSAPKLFALTALILGAVEFFANIIPVIIFKIDANNNFTQPALDWINYLRMLNPVIFALAIINSVRRFDKFTIIAWAGAILAFLGRILLYTIAYI